MSGVGSEMDSSDRISSRSLSDLRRSETRARIGRRPTRTVSLASAPHDGVKAALSERHAREIGQLQIQAPRLLSPIQPDSPLTTPLGSPDVLQENQTWPRMASGTSEQMEEDAPEAALKMRKENVAPAANQQLRADQDSTGLVDAKGDFDIYEDSSAEIESADLRPPTPDISAPQSTERQILSDVIEPDVLADADFDEELLHQLQSMYSSASESDISMRLLHAIEDGFEAKYTAAFDVFYNTRRFFGQPCGIILDAAFSQEHVISSGTATGKSIYGVHGVHGCDAHADDHDADTECEQHCSAPPNTPNASRVPRPADLNSQILHETTEPHNHKTEAPRHQSGDILQSNNCENEPARPQTRQFSLPSRRFPLSRVSTSPSFYNSLPSRRNPITPPRRQHPAFLVSPPRSPLSIGRKKNSPLRPKAVMAWWKERDAAASINNAPNNAPITKPHSRPSSKGSRSSLSNDEPLRGPGRNKKRNPLRRLSSLFGKHKSSHGSLASVRMSTDFHKSSNSLPSQIFLPECGHGTPSFITSTIVKNSRVPAAAGDVLNVSKSRQASESSSIVQQRISSFETPRYIPVEKKYQTSPSYQLLNAIKPVRGRSLKGRFVPSSDGVDAQTEVETVNPVSGTLQDENSASCSESVEPQDHNPFEISTSKSASSHVGELEISDNQDTSEAVSPEQEDSVIINQSEKSERESCGASSILHHIYDSEQVDPSPLPSPDFSDPQIITSTPDRNSALNSPIAPLDDIPINENRQSDSIEAHSLDAASISNTLPKSPTRIMQEIDGNRQLLPPKPRVTSDEKSKVSETVNEFDADDNKENIAPEEELLVAPLERTNVYLGERQMSLSSLSRGAQSEANDEVPALVSKGVKSGKNSRWQKRPLRMVKSAIDSLRVKDVRGSASQEKGRKKRRPSVLNLFKFSRAYEAVNEPDLTGTPSFRVLPTIDSPSIMEPEVSPRSPRRAKSSLGVRLDRKKKPILAVPKYPRRRRSRGNIFGLFEFGRMQQRSSFIVHSDSKPSTPQRNSFASSKFFASRISRRFALNILPLFRRKTFSVPPAPEPQEEDELIQIQRTPSPPPRLELQLPRSGL